MPTLSVILIVHNEIRHIRDCLQSLAFADEIIVVDSGSNDGTVELARELGAEVHCTADWPGFGPQKNRALALARCDWVLSIDADERVSPQLAAEIVAVLQRPEADAFELARLSSFCGHWVRHGGWWPDPVVRLFRRGSPRFSDDLVHERLLLPEGWRAPRLTQPLLHYTYRDLEQVLAKINSYSSAGALMQQHKGRRSSLMGALFHGAWSFFRTYVLRRGFLDGNAGFLIAVMNAEVSFYKYAKLSLLVKAGKP